MLALGEQAGVGVLPLVAAGAAEALGYVGAGLLPGVQALRRLPATLLARK